MQEKELLNPEELQNSKLTTLPEVNTVEEETIAVEVDENKEISEEDLNKRNYIKISPTFYIIPTSSDIEDDERELFKILNPKENTVETRELTAEEEKEVLVSNLKQSKLKYRPTFHPKKTVAIEKESDFIGRGTRIVKIRETQTNITENKFGSAYKKKRKRKNKLTKTSRKNNR